VEDRPVRSTAAIPRRLPRDFWLYFAGQVTSTLGSSFTRFALPLLVFQLTGSATSLGAAMAVTYLPPIMFGLIVGALADRFDRKRMMIGTDVGRGLLVALVPTLAVAGTLHVGWIYAVLFAHSTLRILFNAGQYAGVASLVDKEQLVTANGRIQASSSTAAILGPVLAGLLITTVPVADTLFVDAGTYAVSAASLALIRRSFNEIPAKDHPGAGERGRALIRSLVRDTGEGLRYVWRHPVLRNISIMLAILNAFTGTIDAQLVFWAKHQLHAPNSEIGYLYAAGGFGAVVVSLLAGPLRRRWRFSIIVLATLAVEGLATIGLGLTSTYALALVLWACYSGVGVLFTINTLSLRQQIVPNRLLGRVMSVSRMLAASTLPIGSLAGSFVISATGDIGVVYIVIGVITLVVTLVFSRSPLGRAERYLPGGDLAAATDALTQHHGPSQ